VVAGRGKNMTWVRTTEVENQLVANR
jgi:hypothetical protein